jgi:hypothetical protein
MYFLHVSLNLEPRQKMSTILNKIHHLPTFTDGNGFRTLKAKKLTDTWPCPGYSGRGGKEGKVGTFLCTCTANEELVRIQYKLLIWNLIYYKNHIRNCSLPFSPLLG